MCIRDSSFTVQSWNACRSLRSQRWTDSEVYAVIRLTHCLEQPSKGRAQDLLRKVCQYRNMTWPAAGFSLAIQPLAHPEFLTNVKNWMKTAVLQFKHVLVPFFLPSCTPREAAHPQVVHALHSRKEWEQSFPEYSADSVPCPCHSFQGRVPSDAFVDGHLACGLEMLSVMHPSIALLSQGSGTSAYFLAKIVFFCSKPQISSVA